MCEIKGKKYNYLGLKELNELNTNLYINNKKYKCKKYHKFKEKGEYIIKLNLNILLKDCKYMFSYCKNIINLDLSSFINKNVTDMCGMFANCNNLNNLDLSSFDTKKIVII